MKCFQLVKTVLDELYDEISNEYGNETDTNITSRLSYLMEKFENLEECVDIDYSDPVTRFAYIYRYTTAHANMVYQLIRDLPVLSEAFDTERINVTCLGGGPGSDLLGILKYMSLQNNSTKLNKLRCTSATLRKHGANLGMM